MDIKIVKSLFHLLNFIQTDLEEHKDELLFRENLIVSKFETPDQENPTPVGGLCLDIQSALNNKYVIYVSSKFYVDDATGGSRITTWADTCFQTIEEKRLEFILGKEPEKQSLYIGSEKYGYIVNHTLNQIIHTKRTYSSNLTPNLICEGVNFLLMRLLAIIMFDGSFEMSTLYINGDICRNIYICHGIKSAIVNNTKTEVYKITRIIIEKCGIQHECITVLTNKAHIIKQEWKYCNYVIQLNPLHDTTALSITEEACGCVNAQPLASVWQDDIELMSQYLDKKKLCEHNAHNFLEDTPELTDLLADYVKNLLLHKPDHIVDYTLNYFLRYTK